MVRPISTLVMVLALAACSNDNSSAPSSAPAANLAPLVQAGAWTMRYSPGAAGFGFTATDAGGFTFSFPTHDNTGCSTSDDQAVTCSAAHYVTKLWSRPAAQVTLTATVTLEARAAFSFQTQNTNQPGGGCAAPPNVKILLEAANDDLSTPTLRWWSNPIAIDLTQAAASDTPVTITVPVTPDQWSNVAGQFGIANPMAFALVANNPGIVGITFGGGCFAGHGVYAMGGAATFTLKSFNVE
jgi:hypothetical protein